MSHTPAAPTRSLADRIALLTPEQRARLRGRMEALRPSSGGTSIPRRAELGFAPMSSSQRRFWFLQTLDANGSRYNSGAALRIDGELDEAYLTEALRMLVSRHEALRTVVDEDPQGGVRQHVLESGDIAIERHDLSALAPDQRMAALDRLLRQLRELPLDPRQTLSRYACIRLSPTERVLFFCLHHLIADGWSFGVFMRDLQALYARRALPDCTVHFPDYAAWEAERVRSPQHDEHTRWWIRHLSAAPPALALPAPATPAGGTAMLPLDLPANFGGRLAELSGRMPGATPFVVLTAALQLCLRRMGLNDADDLVIASATAHRNRPEIENIIGNIADVLLLRTRLGDDPTFATLVERVRDELLEAQTHAQVSLAEVIDALERDAVLRGAPASVGARRPPADVLISFMNVPVPEWDADGLQYSLIEIPGDDQDFPLYLSFHDNADGLQGQLSYRRDGLDDAVAHNLADSLSAALHGALADPGQRLSEIPLPIANEPVHAARTDAMRLAAMTEALRALPAVIEAEVRPRGAKRLIVAYLVLDGGIAPERLSDLLEALPATLRPDACCPVARIPLLENGQVDSALLERIPVLDGHWLAAYEASNPEHVAWIEEAADPIPATPARPVSAPIGAATEPQVTSSGTEPRLLALADGGPLAIPAHAPRTLVAALQATVATHPERGLCYPGSDLQAPARHQSYAELYREACERLATLQAHGMTPGCRAILTFDDLRQHITTLWACLLGGIVPVTVAVAPSYRDANSVLGKLMNTWRYLGRPSLLSTASLAGSLRGVHHWLDDAAMEVIAVDTLATPGEPPVLHMPQSGDTALIQLSSGSTGVPKCIAIRHTGVIHHVHAAVQASALADSDVSLNWLPLDHVVPILTCHLTDTILGREQIIARTEDVLAEPLYWLDLIEHYRVTHTWAPNFAYRLVSSRLAEAPDRRWDLSSMRWFVDAGEQSTASVLTEFIERTRSFGLPPAPVHNEFGMAELCTTMTWGAAFDPARSRHRYLKASLRGRVLAAPPDTPEAEVVSFLSAGKPSPGVRLRIADATGATLPEGMIGRLQVQGVVVTPGYIDNAEANAAAFADAGWFDTGDLGFIADGELTLTGRAKETIIIRGANFYCYELEDAVNELPDVRPTFVACCATEDAATGSEGLAVFYVPAAGAAPPRVVRARIVGKLGGSLGIKPTVVVPLEHSEFPKTTSGKIQRGALAQQLRDGVFAQRLAMLDNDTGEDPAFATALAEPFWRRAIHRGSATGADDETRLLLAREAEIPWAAALGAQEFAPEEATQRLVQAMQAASLPVHLIDLDDQYTDVERQLARVLRLADILAAAPRTGVLRVSVGLRLAAETPPGHAPAFAALSAALAALSLETSVPIRCIGLAETNPDRMGQQFLEELACTDAESCVTRQDDGRWVPRLRPLQPGEAEPVFSMGATCLITGGTGALGLSLATHLMRRWQARVLLVGRRPPGAIERELAELRALPGEARYTQCDVSDAGALEHVVRDAEAAWGGPLSHAIHLAGAYELEALALLKPDAIAGQLAAKLDGGRAVLGIVAGRTQTRATLFSSVLVHLPSPHAGLYAAANAALEAEAAHWAAHHEGRCRVIAWSGWPGMGMSASMEDAASLRSTRGLLPITPEIGWRWLEHLLAAPATHSVAGIDSSHPGVRRWLEGTPLRRQALAITSEQGVAPGHCLDLFGSMIGVRHIHLPAMPRDAAGNIDRSALAELLHNSAARVRRPPESEAERRIASLWRQLLGVRKVTAEDNFFALGGHSLLAVQLVARLREQFGVQFSTREIFESPTLEALARRVAPDDADQEYEEGVL